MPVINLYGRKLNITPTWFLTQGYCEGATAHAIKEAAAGRYDPDKYAVWMATHIVTCRQCGDANTVKGSIIEFLKKDHPEWSKRYKQGLMPPPEIIKGWVEYLQQSRPDAMQAYRRIIPQVRAHAEDFEKLYGRGGDGMNGGSSG